MLFRRTTLLFFCWSLLAWAQATVSSSSYLDIYLRVQPVDDFCGARQCNITYGLVVLASQHLFDLTSLMLLEGSMTREGMENTNYLFEDNTVIRLTKKFEDTNRKLYLGLMLYDVPDDIQDYMIVEVTDVVHKGRTKKMSFSSETAKVQVDVYKRNELLSSETNEPVNDNNEVQQNHKPHHHTNSKMRTALSVPSSDSSNVVENNGSKECVCASQSCGCCQHVTIRKIHLDDTACVNVSYISEDIGLKLTLSVDNHVYYSKELSVRNPPPVCFDVPHLREYASLCMRLYNVEVSETSIAGCTVIEAKLYHIMVARERLGCFNIPL